MKSNSKKYSGFGLIEVIISMMIIGIISMSVYSGYILAIKHTKDGQVKQKAALEGKKVIEEIKSTDIQLPASANSIMQIGDISLKKQGVSDVYNRFLDGNFSEVTTESSAKYVEAVSITQTKTDKGNIDFNDNQITEENTEDINYKLNISKESQIDNTIKDFIYDEISSKQELHGQDKIILSLYLEKTDSTHRKISIKNYNGGLIFNPPVNLQCISGIVNININFNNYKQIGTSTLKPVVIDVYNLTTGIPPNIYVEKSNSSDLNVDVEIFKGQMNLYNNRAENLQEAKVGILYDIKLEVMDYSQYKDDQTNNTHDEKKDLFTAYYKQNIQ